jgi:MYXO-CTERM domain-containing protein
MKSRALSRTMPGLVLLLASMMIVMAIPMVMAQAPGTPQGDAPQTTAPGESPRTGLVDNRTDDSSGKWGLIGLVGLLGLVGLMRRDRATAVDRTRERVNRP